MNEYLIIVKLITLSAHARESVCQIYVSDIHCFHAKVSAMTEKSNESNFALQHLGITPSVIG